MKIQQMKNIGVSVFVLVVFTILPPLPGLTIIGKNTIALTIFFLMLLITKPLPLPVICVATLAISPQLSVTQRFQESLLGFATPVLYFTIASFCISEAFSSTPLSKRVVGILLKHFSSNTKVLVLALMICEALFSSVISNIPTTAIFLSVAHGILSLFKDESERKRMAKPLMIAVAISSMIGGMMTPAGSSLNMLAIELLQKQTGITISFVTWMCVGIPLTAVFLPIAWFVITRIYDIPKLEKDTLTQYAEEIAPPKTLLRSERIFLRILTCMVVLWVLSSWFSSIDIYVVAVIGAVLCFLPGLEVLQPDSIGKVINWDVLFVQGAALSMGGAMIKNGVSDWLAGIFFTRSGGLPLWLLIGLTAAFVFFMLILIPIAPAMISVFSAPLISVAVLQGAPPALLILTLAFCTANCYLLPIDSVPLLTYTTGYYSMKDMIKSTAILQMILIALLAIWLPLFSRIMQ